MKPNHFVWLFLMGSVFVAETYAQSGWFFQNPLPQIGLGGVSFTDAYTGTAVGDSGGILRTTNGGETWTSQSSGTTNWLSYVSFTDASTGTVVGGDWNSSVILRTTNGGATWTSQSIDSTSML